jgi:hypothetical protein
MLIIANTSSCSCHLTSYTVVLKMLAHESYYQKWLEIRAENVQNFYDLAHYDPSAIQAWYIQISAHCSLLTF